MFIDRTVQYIAKAEHSPNVKEAECGVRDVYWIRGRVLCWLVGCLMVLDRRRGTIMSCWSDSAGPLAARKQA